MYIRTQKSDTSYAMGTKFTLVFAAEELEENAHETQPNMSTSHALFKQESQKEDNAVMVPAQTKERERESDEVFVPEFIDQDKVISTASQTEAQEDDGHSSKVGASIREDMNTELEKKAKLDIKTSTKLLWVGLMITLLKPNNFVFDDLPYNELF